MHSHYQTYTSVHTIFISGIELFGQILLSLDIWLIEFKYTILPHPFVTAVKSEEKNTNITIPYEFNFVNAMAAESYCFEVSDN